MGVEPGSEVAQIDARAAELEAGIRNEEARRDPGGTPRSTFTSTAFVTCGCKSLVIAPKSVMGGRLSVLLTQQRSIFARGVHKHLLAGQSGGPKTHGNIGVQNKTFESEICTACKLYCQRIVFAQLCKVVL